ncbi:MAG: transglutaminase domain-containing protein [Treponemataceae bacterium]|nr:MAG: transglutaminase domain-containing protein [Treponemataceae bacterium]
MGNTKETCIYLIRKYPLVRTLLLFVVFAAVLCIMRFITTVQHSPPRIKSVNPSVALPGEMVSIAGSGFGAERGSGYVEIAGIRMTSQSYVSWNDEQIRLILPTMVHSGFLTVVTDAGTSNKKVFASKDDIPQPAVDNVDAAVPAIDAIAKISGNTGSEFTVGELVTISGKNFGSVSDGMSGGTQSASVFFSAATNEMHDASGVFVGADEIITQSDTEITVRVPDGAAAGLVYVEVQNRQSNMQRISVKTVGGSKRIYGKHIYVLDYSCDVSDVTMRRQSGKNAPKTQTPADFPVILHVPRPLVCARQPVVDAVEVSGKAVEKNAAGVVVDSIDGAADADGVIVQKVSPEAADSKKSIFSHTFVVNVYSLVTEIDENAIRTNYDKTKELYQKNIAADALVESGSEDIALFAKTIVREETNPYKNARSLYKHVLDTFDFSENARRSTVPLASLIRTKRADSYDISLLYCALLRSLEIPARANAGVLTGISESGAVTAANHWWVEFYIEDFGWVPVDIALVLKTDKADASLRALCFGNLDARHIAFSAGYKTLENTSGYGKSVYRPRTFAFQSLWEESLPEVSRYTSFWSDIEISGMY